MNRREYIDSAYYEGRSGRQDHTSKYACPFGYLTRKWAWWTAGWNDMDMELQLEAQEQSAAAAAPDADSFAA